MVARDVVWCELAVKKKRVAVKGEGAASIEAALSITVPRVSCNFVSESSCHK